MFLEVPQVKNCLTCVLQPFQTLFMVLEPGHICGKMQCFAFNLSVISVGCCKTLQERTQPEFQPVFQLIFEKKKNYFFNSHGTQLPSCRSPAWDHFPLTRFLSLADPRLGSRWWNCRPMAQEKLIPSRSIPKGWGQGPADDGTPGAPDSCLQKPLLLFSFFNTVTSTPSRSHHHPWGKVHPLKQQLFLLSWVLSHHQKEHQYSD